jgi:hypothetical protein
MVELLDISPIMTGDGGGGTNSPPPPMFGENKSNERVAMFGQQGRGLVTHDKFIA